MEEKKKTVFADLGQKGYREVWELQERLLGTYCRSAECIRRTWDL